MIKYNFEPTWRITYLLIGLWMGSSLGLTSLGLKDILVINQLTTSFLLVVILLTIIIADKK